MKKLHFAAAAAPAIWMLATAAAGSTPAERLHELIAECERPGSSQTNCERDLWTFVDVTGDGELTPAEITRFGRVLAVVRQKGSPVTARSQDDYAFLLSPILASFALTHWDYDGNGSISREELYLDMREGGIREFIAQLTGAGESLQTELSASTGFGQPSVPQRKPPTKGEPEGIDREPVVSEKFDANRIADLLGKWPQLTVSEIDAIRVQIQKCWSVPSGVRYAENLRVQIRIFLNPDGSLARAPEVVGNTSQRDVDWRTAAESARRAVLRCSPLKSLPVEKYESWREITLTFDPKEMLGG